MIDQQMRRALFDAGDATQRYRSAIDTGHMDALDCIRPKRGIRPCLQHHPVLVGLGEDGGDLALPERVVQRIGHRIHADAQPRRCDPVNHHMRLQAAILQIAGDVLQCGLLL